MRISDWSSDVCSSDLLDKNTAADGQHGLFPQLEGSGLISRTGGIQEQPVNRAFPSNAVSKLGGFANVGPCRSEERRAGTECVGTCSSRWSPLHKKKKLRSIPHTRPRVLGSESV